MICGSYIRKYHFYVFQKKKKTHSDDIYDYFWINHHLFSPYHRNIRLLYNPQYIFLLCGNILWNCSQSPRRKILLPYWRRQNQRIWISSIWYNKYRYYLYYYVDYQLFRENIRHQNQLLFLWYGSDCYAIFAKKI